MQKKSKNHHFVPASLLRYFSINGLKKQVWVLDKATGRSFAPAIENAGSENNFNKLKLPGGELIFEELFAEVDTTLHALLQEAHEIRSLESVSEATRAAWADVIAAQMFRTPLARSTHVSTAADLVSSLVKAGVSTEEMFTLPTDNGSRRLTLESFLHRAPFWASLLNKDMVLLEATGGGRFWISDNPVVLDNVLPYGDAGLEAPGIAIYFPIGSDLLLALLCKSIRATLDPFPDALPGIKQSDLEFYLSLRHGLRTGTRVRCTDETVAAFNRLQLSRSKRFIYSREDISELVNPVLEHHPHLRSVETLVRIGELGHGPPPSPRMPEGKWLVLFGQVKSYMVQMSEWTDDSFPLEVVVEDIATMNQALRDGPFKEMRMYEDRSEVRMMRDVRVEILSATRPARVSIRHFDESLDALDQMIREHTGRS